MAVETRLPKVLIASHECSGAQFLLDSLVSNFGYSDLAFGLTGFNEYGDDEFGLPSLGERSLAYLTGHWSSGLLKSHYAFGFYADWLRSFGSQMRIIYIVRDVLPVMRSFQRYLFPTRLFEGARVASGSEFVRTTPTGPMLRFQDQPAHTMVHRWANHVRGWLKGAKQQNRQSFSVLRFDSLHEDFESTMQDIANFLNLQAPSHAIRPRKSPHSHSTESGFRTGLPTEEFRLADCDLDFIESVTRPLYESLAVMGRALKKF